MEHEAQQRNNSYLYSSGVLHPADIIIINTDTNGRRTHRTMAEDNSGIRRESFADPLQECRAQRRVPARRLPRPMRLPPSPRPKSVATRALLGRLYKAPILPRSSRMSRVKPAVSYLPRITLPRLITLELGFISLLLWGQMIWRSSGTASARCPRLQRCHLLLQGGDTGSSRTTKSVGIAGTAAGGENALGVMSGA